MSVITFTPALLRSASSQLAQRVVGAGFTPEVVVGILNGGAQVGRLLIESLPAATSYCEVYISRPSTRQKQQSAVSRLMRSMPLWLCNMLREFESFITSLRRSKSLSRIGEVVLPVEVESKLQQPCKVLVVDDAIDSGTTIQKVKQQLLSQYPAIDLRIAVVTVTTSAPVCDADFCLYHNHTLCRFPWSNDYR